MTRFDTYVKTLILSYLHVQENSLNARQLDVLQLMMKEIYENKKLLTMDIEHKVHHIAEAYRPKLSGF